MIENPKVGDRVKVIDAGGDYRAKVGMTGTVTEVKSPNFGLATETLLTVRPDDGRAPFSQYARRFERLPRFAEGDRVVRTGPHVKTLGGSYEHESEVGMTGVVAARTGSRVTLHDDDVRVTWDKPLGWSKTSQIAASSLSLAPETFEVGDKVLIVKDGPASQTYSNWRDNPEEPMRLFRSRLTLPVEGTVASASASYSRPGDPILRVNIAGGDHLYVRPCQIEKAPADPIDAEGTQVYVTGDTDGWGHGIKAGTLVTVIEDDSLLDGSYLVETEDDTNYVGVSDIDVVKPGPVYAEGDFVVVRNGGGYHYLTDGSVAEVLTAPGRPGRNFLLRGMMTDGRMGSQYVPARDVTSAPLAAYRPGDKFPNVGYVRHMIGREVR